MTRNQPCRYVHVRGLPAPRQQRGAALFVALMVLVLLSLLALSASQVTSLQQRMAGIYSADHLAFQQAEAAVRDREALAAAQARLEGGCLDGNNAFGTSTVIDPTWLDGTQATPNVAIANISGPTSNSGVQSSSQQGGQSTVGDPNCLFFAVTSYDFDNDASPTSRAIIQSIYSP